MKKVTIALIGAVVLAIGVVGGSRKAEATNRKRMTAYVPAEDGRFSYEEVNVESYEVKDGLLHVTTDCGYEYIGNNIVIEKWEEQ
ncbi:hypothetical protein SEQ01_18280 [Streptococcus equinus]|uniref:hypothetical protein n=1 Tax=Streptococcus equinus TaxID=1335 RepID=UPI001141FBAD|nr:hypothetical protein [Streptococcus equinus]GEB11637.1 hypothetical protein SEQ01_18280 [Streptococcus equinus]